MSDATEKKLARLGIVLAVAGSLTSLFGAFVLLPYRMDAAEKAIVEVQQERKADRELLIRIDERTARMEKALERQGK